MHFSPNYSISIWFCSFSPNLTIPSTSICLHLLKNMRESFLEVWKLSYIHFWLIRHIKYQEIAIKSGKIGKKDSFSHIDFCLGQFHTISSIKCSLRLLLIIHLVHWKPPWTKSISIIKGLRHLVLKINWISLKLEENGKKLSFSLIFHDFLAISWYLMCQI